MATTKRGWLSEEGKELSEDECLRLVKEQPRFVLNIADPSEAVQLLAVQSYQYAMPRITNATPLVRVIDGIRWEKKANNSKFWQGIRPHALDTIRQHFPHDTALEEAYLVFETMTPQDPARRAELVLEYLQNRNTAKQSQESNSHGSRELDLDDIEVELS